MTYKELVAEVMERGGFERRAQAQEAIEATLDVLGERLLDIDAQTVAESLPEPLGRILRRRRYSGDFDRAELVRRVAKREGVRPGFAHEHVVVVFRALAERLGDDALAHLRRRLPVELVELFDSRAGGAVRPMRVGAMRVAPGEGTTLASGRPGGHRPLSEASPAQANSVVATDNPHADTKLSTSRGTSTERQGDTLATGRPGSKRPLSDGAS